MFMKSYSLENEILCEVLDKRLLHLYITNHRGHVNSRTDISEILLVNDVCALKCVRRLNLTRH